MTVVEDGVGGGGIVARVKNILVSPKAEWERIEAEPSSIRGIYLGYVCILAAIPVLASAVGSLAFGHGIPGLAVWRPSPVAVVTTSIISYLLALAGVAIIAFVIDALAPSFGGAQNRIQAFKVAAYASTAGWVAAIFNIIPMLGFLALIGSLYGLYLIYLGLPVLMKAPQDKAVGYTVVVVIVWIVVFFIVAAIVGALVASFFGVGALTGGTIRY